MSCWREQGLIFGFVLAKTIAFWHFTSWINAIVLTQNSFEYVGYILRKKHLTYLTQRNGLCMYIPSGNSIYLNQERKAPGT